MAERERVICAAGELLEAGRGVRFETQYRGETVPAFGVRVCGQVHAYLNRCARIAMELEWLPGVFFDAAGRNLICSTHAAVFAADSGKCLGGPYAGRALVRLAVEESGGVVLLKESSNG